MASRKRWDYRIQEKVERDEGSRLHVVIAGAGLAGLGTSISVQLAGHSTTVLEACPGVTEVVGAGIQILPNAARVLFSWGLEGALERFATMPARANFWGWRGNHLSEMDFRGYEDAGGVEAPFWDFHRKDLRDVLLRRATELGAVVRTGTKVVGFECFGVVSDEEDEDGEQGRRRKSGVVRVHLADASTIEANLLVAADGIHSHLRACFLGRPDPPIPTGDLAYRLLLNTQRMRDDPSLRPLVEDPQVNYWLGPDVHVVNYVLRGGEQLNMVLLVPDDIPLVGGGGNGNNNTVVEGDAAEMRAHLQGWDERLGKLASMCEERNVLKWRLCMRPGLEPSWSHPSGCFTMLGDAVHATLPYLASGAGMALEDAGVLGLCLARIKDRSAASKRLALKVYEECRRERTERVVKRGSYNQWIYHLHDGPQQEARDERLRRYGDWDREWLRGERPVLPNVQETGDDPFPWRYNGVGRWLLTYDMWKDVEEKWDAVTTAAAAAGAAGEEEALVQSVGT